MVLGPIRKIGQENMLKLLAGLSANNTGKIGTQAEILVRVNHPETAAGRVICRLFISADPLSWLMLPSAQRMSCPGRLSIICRFMVLTAPYFC